MTGLRTCSGFSLVGVFLLAMGILSSGCMVSKSRYESVLQEMENAKAELEKNRMVAKALEQELQKAKAEREKASIDLEMMASELKQIKEGRDNERVLLETRERELEKKLRVLTEKMKRMKREYQKVLSQNAALKATNQRYKKELKNATAQKATGDKPSASTQSSSSSPPSTATAKKTTPADSSPVTSSFNGELAPVNINTASANDLVLFLGLTKSMAEKVVANRPYRLRGELVAKQVIPKATFDVIKDRITAKREK